MNARDIDDMEDIIDPLLMRKASGKYIAKMLVRSGYRRPRIITTTEELDALPTDSTVRSSEGGVWFKETSGGGSSWTEPGAQWWHFASDIGLPATVLYEPEATR